MRRSRLFTITIAAASGAVVLSIAGTPTVSATPAPAPSNASDSPQKVIVMLRDQLASSPASKGDMAPRRDQAVASQDAVLNRLAGAPPTAVTHFGLANAFSATVSTEQVAALAQDPQVASVVPDRAVVLPPPTEAASSPAGSQAKSLAPSPGGKLAAAAPHVETTGPFALCPSDPAKPLIEPEALQSIHARTSDGTAYAQQLATGAGVKVAYIADAVDPNAPDFIRPGGSHVFVDYQDFSGSGPSTTYDGLEAFGDASAIAAQGTEVHDLSTFVNQAHPLPRGCNIRVVGVAPGASLVGLVFGSDSSILQAIDYAVTTDHVDVINESFGLNAFPDTSMKEAVLLFNDAAVDAGVTVTKSSGDGGITNTIQGGDPKVITVAATTDFRIDQQTSATGTPFSNGHWVNDNISALSSSGITNFGHTVDLAAPGEDGWAACGPAYDPCRNYRLPDEPSDLQSFGGTSQSAPLTAGAAALVIEAYRSTHAGASPTPAVVKRILTGTAHDLGVPAEEQGSGLLDARAATEAALTWPGGSSTGAGLGSHIVTSDDQMTLTGKPGTATTGRVTVTNVGTKPLTVHAAARDYRTFASSQQSVPFDSRTLPTFVTSDGTSRAEKEIHFTVPSGGQRLLVRMAFQGVGPDDYMRLTLLDPSGAFVASNSPQGVDPPANYANVDVRNPTPGRWTALLYSKPGAIGYHATPLIFRADVQRAVPVGQISPASFSLGAGQSRSVLATFHMPDHSGDTAYALSFVTSTGQQTAVATILRALIDTTSGGAYSGTITGGNARPLVPAQTTSYAFDVPPNRRDLDVSLRLAKDPNTYVDLVLLDPNSEVADVGTNLTVDDVTGSTVTTRLTAQLFDAHPLPGRWHLVVVVQTPVSGAEISQAFSGNITFDRLDTHATGLPDSTTTLPAGKPSTVHVQVRNTGVQPILVGVDPRLDEVRTLTLSPIFGTSPSFELPYGAGPEYLLPPDTQGFTAAATSTVPAQVEIANGAAFGVNHLGDLQAAKAGKHVSVATVSESRGYITPGLWFSAVSEIGPFGDAGAPPGQSTISASISAPAFDPAVTSSTDDPFRIAVDPSSDGYGTPVFIEPGHVGTIGVTMTPHGKKGSVVRGHLNLVTPSTFPTGPTSLPQVTTGAVIQSLPYEYRIG